MTRKTQIRYLCPFYKAKLSIFKKFKIRESKGIKHDCQDVVLIPNLRGYFNTRNVLEPGRIANNKWLMRLPRMSSYVDYRPLF